MIKVSTTHSQINCPKETLLIDAVKKIEPLDYKNIIAAKQNHDLIDLNTVLKEDMVVEFVNYNHKESSKIVEQSTLFLFCKACSEIVPNAHVSYMKNLEGDIFCELKFSKYPAFKISKNVFKQIKSRMIELKKRDIAIISVTTSVTSLISFYEKRLDLEKVKLLKSLNEEFLKVYTCDGYMDFVDSILVPSTSYIKDFNLLQIEDSNVIKISFPTKPNFNMKLLNEVLFENHLNSQIVNCKDFNDLNSFLNSNKLSSVISYMENFHEEKIQFIAKDLVAHNKQIVLIAGPSSSGKTTFASRLENALRDLGGLPVTISTDDYFVNRDATPCDENGNKNFEAFECIDIESFNKDLQMLLSGVEVNIPTFDFVNGVRTYDPLKRLKLEKGQSIIIEGIHSLNPKLTSSLEDSLKYKIYISPITSLKTSLRTLVSSSDLRLIRRIVRDFNFRGRSAEETLLGWSSVRKGEVENIYPYQHLADATFNSDLLYELSVFKKDVTRLLEGVSESSEAFSDAYRLLNMINKINEAPSNIKPPESSILREFLK